MKVKDLLIDELLRNNIETIFTLPAYYITDFTCTLQNNGIKIVEFRNEYNASFAALAYSLCGKGIGVLAINTGPSYTNSLTGIKTAQKELIPLLVLVGIQEKEKCDDDFFFQTINMSENFAKKVYTLENNIAYTLEQCMIQAKEHPRGPVILRMPIDLLQREIKEKIEKPVNCKKEVLSKDISKKNDIDIKKFILKLSKYEFPLFIFGKGIKGGEYLLKNFPFYFSVSIMMKSEELYSCPKYVGSVGILGDTIANRYLEQSDLLICVGCRLSERTLINKEHILRGKHIVYVNISDNFCRYKETIYEVYKFDAFNFIKEINNLNLEILEPHILNNIALSEKKTSENCKLTVNNAIEKIMNGTFGNSLFCVDDGLYTLSALFHNKYGNIIFYGSMAAGGSSVGSSIGASIACKDEMIVLVIGDGGILSVLGELQTIVKYKLNILILLFNNKGYESIRQWFPESYRFDFGYIDFSAVAQAFHLQYKRIEVLEDLNLCEIVRGPMLYEIMIENEKMKSHFN